MASQDMATDMNSVSCSFSIGARFWFCVYRAIALTVTAIALLLTPVLQFFSRRIRTGTAHFLGLVPRLHSTRVFWVHGVSMGETMVASGFVAMLRQHYPDCAIFFTTTHPDVLANVAKRRIADAAAYFPFDNVVAMSVAMNRIRPSAVFVAETDFWPEFSWQCRRAGIPLILVNGRISYKIADFYLRFRGLAETVFQSYSLLAVQSESDAKRLLDIGVKPEKIMVTGNMKADLTMAATTVDVSPFRRWLSGRLCVVFGSLHPCEFNVLLPAFASLAAKGFALLIAPRNPANAGGWAKQLADINITACCRNEIEKAADAPVLVLDTMGELAGLYHLGTAAFVGGSLDKTVGGHNPLEVIQQRVPLLMGPDCRNFADLCEQLRQENAILVCPDADSVTRSAEALADGTYSAGEMVDRAWNVLERNLGAMEKTMIEVRKLLKR